ncbi:head decoration protein [Pseudomonas sp. NPDC086581]|uniref:head decoration protein n=1 Tax=Pseudomonas sp. NPDC086581 TaxID=3364432 RepID=UPI003828FDBC
MTIKKEPFHPGEYLISEGPGSISRETVTLAAGPTLYSGQLLGQITSSKQYAPYNPAATDGTKKAVAILHNTAPASAKARPALVIIRLAEASRARLTGLDAAAETALASQYIIVR